MKYILITLIALTTIEAFAYLDLSPCLAAMTKSPICKDTVFEFMNFRNKYLSTRPNGFFYSQYTSNYTVKKIKPNEYIFTFELQEFRRTESGEVSQGPISTTKKEVSIDSEVGCIVDGKFTGRDSVPFYW